ncbi:MAG: thioredoxin-disulfide reductase [Gammaproteobacteria bacterium RIFCSPHIGHO2_12_FULL_37_14]|nr:MAG: thioredoxin-disulfide reductase [Gammaproteobacteria bacterium RIFCSPHIGHO2_12_FULL_37_14]
MQIYKLIIVGAGPAGLTAGIYAGRAELKPLIIEGPEPGGQLMGTGVVENWPGEKAILGPKLMENIKEQAKLCGCEFKSTSIEKTDFSQKPFKLWTKKNELLQAESIILASGAVPNKLKCPGETEYWGKGISSCVVCDGALYKGKQAIIVGGGDSAMEYAYFMTKFTNKITIVQILDKLTASIAMQKKVIDNQDIKIIYSSTIAEIKGDGSHISEAVIKNQKTGVTQNLKTDVLFIAIGLHPQTEFLQGQVKLDKFGYIEVQNHTKTSVDGVFACGDIVDYRYRQAITSAGAGCMAALDSERYLSSIKT